ncbi:MAG: zinc ribbon domain-containing protein [Candidatus Bathyarchaeota archaeon]|nr:zinc ribbon domain-containing protein [Candidatus Bathyarchaeota archaeon]
MVYCPECGADNEEEAVYCTKCGAPLKEGAPRVRYARRRGEKDEKAEKGEKREKEEKYEKEGDARMWGLLVGLLIIIAGVISLLETWYWYAWDRLWPALVIVVGLFIIWYGLRARKLSPRP